MIEFGEDDYAEYEPVIGNRVRDLNKERNFKVETMKKNWDLRKASHYKIRDQHPVQKYASMVNLSPANRPFLVAEHEDFEIPIIRSSAGLKVKKIKKRKTKKFIR